MNKAAQVRVSAMLKGAWGDRVKITHQRDGGLVAYVTTQPGQTTIIVVGDESSPLLRMIGRVYLGESRP